MGSSSNENDDEHSEHSGDDEDGNRGERRSGQKEMKAGLIPLTCPIF